MTRTPLTNVCSNVVAYPSGFPTLLQPLQFADAGNCADAKPFPLSSMPPSPPPGLGVSTLEDILALYVKEEFARKMPNAKVPAEAAPAAPEPAVAKAILSPPPGLPGPPGLPPPEVSPLAAVVMPKAEKRSPPAPPGLPAPDCSPPTAVMPARSPAQPPGIFTAPPVRRAPELPPVLEPPPPPACCAPDFSPVVGPPPPSLPPVSFCGSVPPSCPPPALPSPKPLPPVPAGESLSSPTSFAEAKGSEEVCNKGQSPFVQCETLEDGSCLIKWTLNAGKLMSSDKQIVSPQFDVVLPCDQKHSFTIKLSPQEQSQQKAGGSFKKAKGKGMVELKCTSDSRNAPTLLVQFGVGDLANSINSDVTEHDFAEKSTIQLKPSGKDVWEIKGELDRSKDQVVYVKIRSDLA